MPKAVTSEKKIQHILHKKRIVLFSVLAVGAIIATMWGFAFRNRLHTFDWAASSENQLFKSAKNDLQEASDMIERPIREQAAAKEQVRATLQNIISEAISSSTLYDMSEATSTTSTTSTN